MARAISLQRFLKDADVRVREAAAKALNAAANELQNDIKQNMAAVGIKNRTGRLRGSIVVKSPATEKRLNVVLQSEVYAVNPKTGALAIPKRPGSRNPAMRGRYRNGVPYGRILEFSPRLNKPFFYTAWYRKRKQIKDDVINKISGAWSNG